VSADASSVITDLPAVPEEPPPTFEIGFDAVFGFGDVPAVNQSIPDTQGTPSQVSKDDTPVTVDSYIASVGWRFLPHLRLGARLPFVHAVLNPEPVKKDRNIFALGNIEFNAGLDFKVGSAITLFPKVAVTIPMAAGEEPPPAVELNQNDTSDPGPRDRFSGMRAASASRGFEETGLFSSRRVGISPGVSTIVKVAGGRVAISPFLKLDGLVSLSSSAQDTFVADGVGGLGFFYRIADEWDVGARAWANVTFIGFDDLNDRLLAIAEPQVRAHFGAFHPSIGALCPLYPFFTQQKTDRTIGGVSDATFDPRFFAFRLAIDLRF